MLPPQCKGRSTEIKSEALYPKTYVVSAFGRNMKYLLAQKID
jgi:hypothetical protein